MDVSDHQLADMIATLTLRDEFPERIPLGNALIELRQLRRWWSELRQVLPDIAADIERSAK